MDEVWVGLVGLGPVETRAGGDRCH
eukprot:SAG22_NODE_9343_length_594_cov_1.135354_1_plen_24_part_01